MNHLLSSISSAAIVLGTLAAQKPEEGTIKAPHAEVALVSLQSLANETIVQRQPLADAPGTASLQPFARVRDVRFAPDGRLVAWIVESAKQAPGEEPIQRELPAELAHWDAASRRWLTIDPNLTFAGLVAVSKPKSEAEPAANVRRRSLLASKLMLATAVTTAAAPAIESVPPTTTAPSTTSAATFWLAPAHQTLAFAVVQHGTNHVPLPCSLLDLTKNGDRVEFRIVANPAMLAKAPLCKDAGELPSAELRQRCYAHFGLPLPIWDGAPRDPGSGKDRDKTPDGDKRDDRRER